jgi:transglutaminase-like putative cysteine protease
MARSCVVLFSLVLPLYPAIAAAKSIDPTNPPEGRFSDQWLEIYLGGQKIGYGHSTMGRDGELMHSDTTMHMRIGRADQAIEVSVRRTTVETVAGVPLSFESEMNMATMVVLRQGTIRDGRVTIKSSQYGMETSDTYPFPEGAVLAAWGAAREGLIRGFKPGTEYTIEVYEPDFRLDGAIKAVTKIGDWEDFEARGRKLRGQRVTVIMESPIGSLETVSWVDKDGEPLKAKIPIAGLEMETIATDQATAMTDFVTPELFMTTVIKANTKIDRQSAKRVKYRIKGKSADVDLGELPTTDMQKVIARDDRSVEVVVTRQSHEPDPKRKTQKPAKEPTEYLSGNLMINTADPELIALAKRAAGGETEPFALADKLRRFVTDYVEDKNLNIAFATASEVCRNKEGDCSEHAVLLAALGRINGLPSRVAVGLAYVPVFGREQDIFGYHMWTQFLIDGRWVDVDAALRETECSPTRIAFVTASLKSTGLVDLALPLLSKIGAIDIDILEIDGRKTPTE